MQPDGCAARRITWAGMYSRLELVALVRRCFAFGASQDLLKARVNSRPSQPLWSCPDRLPSLRFCGFSNPFLKIGVRGGDSAAGRELARAMSKPLACDGRPRWKYPVCCVLTWKRYLRICIRRQTRALPALSLYFLSAPSFFGFLLW